IETEYHGRKAGTFGDFGCFSFYVTKNVITAEGGMILARDEEHISRAKVLALHGMSKDAWHRFGDKGYKHYQVVECGFKYNMGDVQAARGMPQVERVGRNWLSRKEVWELSRDALSERPLLLADAEGRHIRHALHLYTIQVDPRRWAVTRADFLERMNSS